MRESKERSKKSPNSLSYYVVSESLPLLFLEGLTKAQDELVQFLGVAAQELLDILQALQAVRGQRVLLCRTRVHLDGARDAQDAVALLLVVVERFLKQDGDRRRSRKARPQQDLPVLDPDILKYTTTGMVQFLYSHINRTFKIN